VNTGRQFLASVVPEEKLRAVLWANVLIILPPANSVKALISASNLASSFLHPSLDY